MSNCNPTPEQELAFNKLREVSLLLITAGWNNVHANVPGTNVHIKWKVVSYKEKCDTHKYWKSYFQEKERGIYCPDCGELLNNE